MDKDDSLKSENEDTNSVSYILSNVYRIDIFCISMLLYI